MELDKIALLWLINKKLLPTKSKGHPGGGSVGAGAALIELLPAVSRAVPSAR